MSRFLASAYSSSYVAPPEPLRAPPEPPRDCCPPRFDEEVSRADVLPEDPPDDFASPLRAAPC